MGNLRKNLRGRRRRQAVKIFRHNPCVFMNMYLLWLHCFFIFWLKFNCLQRVFLSEKIGDSCCTEILIVLNCKTPVNQYSIKYSAPSMIPVACARQLSLNIKDLSRKSPRDTEHTGATGLGHDSKPQYHAGVRADTYISVSGNAALRLLPPNLVPHNRQLVHAPMGGIRH